MSLRRVVLVGVYALTAALWLYAPLFNSATHLPGDPSQPVTTDFYHFHWNYWWIRHALTHGLDVYQTNYIFTPETSSLALHTLTPLWYPIWAALEPMFGTVTAMNAVMFAGLLLNGVVMHAFLRRQGASHGWALIGGLLLQGSEVIFIALKWTMVSLLGWFWLPLALLVWERVAAGGQQALRWTLLLGFTLWAMLLTDIQYALFLAFLLVPVGLWTLWRAPDTRARLLVIGRGAGAIVLALTLLWLAGPLHLLLAFDRAVLASTPANRAPHVEFPLGYLWRGEYAVSLGFMPLLLVTAGALAYRKLRPRGARVPPLLWLALAVPPLILSVGASLPLLGAEIPMPYHLLHDLLGGTFRYPERFANVFLIAGMAFALPALSAWTRGWRLRRWALVGLLLLLFIDLRLLAPLPLQPIPPAYTIYEQMGREPYDYAVVEIPTAGASGEGIVGRSEWAALQFYGITHGKRMVNGHISRVDPWRYLRMETDDAMLAWLGQRRYLEPELVTEQMRERIFGWPIGYFVLHTRFLPGNGPTVQELVGFFNAQDELLCPPTVEHDLIIYRTRWHPDGCEPRTPPETAPGVYALDVGAAGDVGFIGWGWHYAEPVGGIDWRWAGDYPRLGAEAPPADGHLYADLFFDLPPGDYTLTLEAQSYYEARTVRLFVNDAEVGTQIVGPEGLSTVTVEVPAQAVGTGEHVRLRLVYDGGVVPRDMGQGEDARRLAISVNRVEWARRSAD